MIAIFACAIQRIECEQQVFPIGMLKLLNTFINLGFWETAHLPLP